MFFGQKKIIGLDIGSTSIKLAEVDVSRKGAVLQSFAMAPTPAQSVVGGDLLDAASIGETVAQLVQEVKTKRKSAATGLWGSAVIVKKISVPAMEESLLSEQIRWEVEQYIPFDINEVNIDYKVIGRGGGAETMDILLVAARHDAVFRFAEAVSSSGLSCDVLDVNGFALANCFEKNYGIIEGQCLGLLNIGSSMTNFAVVESGEVVFCRDLPIGGANYTAEIQKGMSISMQEAESMKISSSLGQPVPEEVTALINQSHEAISEEIGNSIDFYLNASHGSPISQCFVTGGGAKISGLLGHMSRSLTIPCEIFDPFLNVQVNEKKISAQYLSEVRDFASVALGLGLREPGGK